jgi:hypothetical protein
MVEIQGLVIKDGDRLKMDYKNQEYVLRLDMEIDELKLERVK